MDGREGGDKQHISWSSWSCCVSIPGAAVYTAERVCLLAVLCTGGEKTSRNHWNRSVGAFSLPGSGRQAVLGLGNHLRMSRTQVPSSFLLYRSYRLLEGSKLF